MFEPLLLDDPGDDLSGAVVEALRSAAAVRSVADAVELQAIATLVQVRRAQARTEALRRAEVYRRERAGSRSGDGGPDVPGGGGRQARPGGLGRVDVDLVDRCTAQEVSVALWLSPVVARARVQLALELVQERPATFDALRCGDIDLVRARRIVEGVRTLAGALSRDRDAWEQSGTSGAGDPAGPVDEHDLGDPADDADAADGGPADLAADEREVDVASAVEAEVLCPGSVPVLADLRPGRPASQLTPAQVTARVNRLVLRAAPETALRRTAVADQGRGCSLRVLPDGMALLSVTGRLELLGAAFTRIDATARALLAADATAGDGDSSGARPAETAATSLAETSPSGENTASATSATATTSPAVTAAAGRTAGSSSGAPSQTPHDAARSLDQARVDVFLATVLGHSDDLAHAHGVQVTLALVAPAGTVLSGGDEPGELTGLGPVPAPLARELAADAAWTRWTTDPASGHVTDVARRTYRPSAAVADLVRARDSRCRFPTCRRRAHACDLDHVTAYPAGATHPDNLATLCRTHHLTKHHSGFHLRIDPDGTTTWTTPTGHRVTDHPSSWGRPPGLPPGDDRCPSGGVLDPPDADRDPPPF